jgi:hypothetical protein
VRRRGRNALVTWDSAALAGSYYVSARYGDGRDISLIPRRGARRVIVPNVLGGEGLQIAVGAISPADRLGPVAHASLAGNMHVGRVRRLPKHKRPKPGKKHR